MARATSFEILALLAHFQVFPARFRAGTLFRSSVQAILRFEMLDDADLNGLTPARRRYLEEKYALDPDELALLLDDLRAFTEETLEDFVRRRHGELQRSGLRNEAIYRRLAAEAARGRFRHDGLSLRQIRRIVYG